MHFGYRHYDQDPAGFAQDVLKISVDDQARAIAPVEGLDSMNFSGWFTDTGIDTGGGFQIPVGVGREVGEVLGEIFTQAETLPAGPVPGGIPQVATGVQGSRSLCWQPSDDPDTIRRRYARRRVKMVRVPDNTPQRWHWEMREYCAPRKMNYCNPRALGRAARRLGGLQAMAGAIEKVISHALRKKGGRSRSYSRRPLPGIRSCFPAKRRCR